MEIVLTLPVEYVDEKSFRQAVEKKSKASTTDAEWSRLTQEWHPPYDDLDLAEMVSVVREAAAQKPKLSQAAKARQGRRAHVERTARQPRQLVESYRMDLFGHTYPPYPNRGPEAAEWIESEVETPKAERLTITVTIPAHLKPMERLAWVIDHLAGKLDSWPSTGNGDGAVAHFMKHSGDVREVGWSIPVLEYVRINADGEIEIRHVYAPDGTLLGRLQHVAGELAKALGWNDYAALHHLLTGGVLAHPAVQVSGQHRTGRQSFGDPNPMTLTILDPDTVTEKELASAYRIARSNKDLPWGAGHRQRSRGASKSERVAAFVEETPDISWAERLEEWNRRNPEERYRTVSSLKSAKTRGTPRH